MEKKNLFSKKKSRLCKVIYLFFRGGLSFDIINATNIYSYLVFCCISWRPLRITCRNKSSRNKYLSIKKDINVYKHVSVLNSLTVIIEKSLNNSLHFSGKEENKTVNQNPVIFVYYQTVKTIFWITFSLEPMLSHD